MQLSFDEIPVDIDNMGAKKERMQKRSLIRYKVTDWLRIKYIISKWKLNSKAKTQDFQKT